MNHLVGDQRGLKFMVIPQPSLSEKVINRAASPTHSFESFGIISTDSFSFHSLGVGCLAQSPATLNPSKEPTNPDTATHVGNVIKSVIGVEERKRTRLNYTHQCAYR